MSADFHEYRHSKRCPFGADTNKCWYNAITAAVSTDGGLSFRPLREPPAHYVAGPSVRYDLDAGRSIGFFTISNIVQSKGHYYALVYTGGGFAQQRRGVCVLRTAALDDPSSWRAWDGKGYGYAFADPYRDGQDRTGRSGLHAGRAVLPDRARPQRAAAQAERPVRGGHADRRHDQGDPRDARRLLHGVARPDRVVAAAAAADRTDARRGEAHGGRGDVGDRLSLDDRPREPRRQLSNFSPAIRTSITSTCRS